MRFDRKKPCKTCPFRTNEDGLRGLNRERAEEIADCIRSERTFTCHDDLDKEPRKQRYLAATATAPNTTGQALAKALLRGTARRKAAEKKQRTDRPSLPVEPESTDPLPIAEKIVPAWEYGLEADEVVLLGQHHTRSEARAALKKVLPKGSKIRGQFLRKAAKPLYIIDSMDAES